MLREFVVQFQIDGIEGIGTVERYAKQAAFPA